MPNKLDLVAEDESMRQVYEDQIIEYAEINNLLYVGQCSASQDLNIKGTIDEVVKRIYDEQKRLGLIDNSRPRLRLNNTPIESGGGCCGNCTPSKY